MDIGGKLSLSFGNFLMLTALSRWTDGCVPLPQSAPTPSISATWSPILNPIGSYIRTACVTPSGLNMGDTPCTQRKKPRVMYQDWGFPAPGKRKYVCNPEVSQPLVSEVATADTANFRSSNHEFAGAICSLDTCLFHPRALGYAYRVLPLLIGCSQETKQYPEFHILY